MPPPPQTPPLEGPLGLPQFEFHDITYKYVTSTRWYTLCVFHALPILEVSMHFGNTKQGVYGFLPDVKTKLYAY